MRHRLPIVIAASVLLAACGVFRTGAAVVNDQVIDQDLFDRQLDFLLADPRFAQQELPVDQQEQQRQEFMRQFLTFLIHQELVDAYAAVRDITVSEEEIDQELQGQIDALGGREAFDAQLAASGASIEDVESLLSEQVLRQKVAQAVVAEQLTNEDLFQTYEERRTEFTTADIAHILVPTRPEAERIARDATTQNFAELARRFSQDPGSAQRGGDIGVQRLADLTGPFADAVLEIGPDAIGGPVQTEFGWHVILVRDVQTQPFSAVRDQLLEEARADVFTDWLLEQVRAAEIRVNPRYGAFEETSGQVIARTESSPSPPPEVQVQP